MSLIPNAFANTASATTSASNGFLSFLPMIVIFALFWLLLIRPQQKKLKLHNAMLAALDVGNEVVTSGGIIGKITKLQDQTVSVEIANNVVITVQRSAITNKIEKNSTELTNKK